MSYSVCDSFSFPCLTCKLTQFRREQGVDLLRIVSGGTSIPRFVLNYKWCQGKRVCFTGNKCSRKHLFFLLHLTINCTKTNTKGRNLLVRLTVKTGIMGKTHFNVYKSALVVR